MTAMMERAGKDKITIINLNRFEDAKGKHEPNYEGK